MEVITQNIIETSQIQTFEIDTIPMVAHEVLQIRETKNNQIIKIGIAEIETYNQ